MRSRLLGAKLEFGGLQPSKREFWASYSVITEVIHHLPSICQNTKLNG